MTKTISKLTDINMDLKKAAADSNRTFAQQLQHMADNDAIDSKLFNRAARNSKGAEVPAWRQAIAAAGIDLRGKRQAQTVGEAFFRDDANRILFPLYIEERYREIQNERRNTLTYADLVAERIPMTAGQTIAQIPTLRDDPTNTNNDPSRIAEGAEFPVIQIEMGDQTVRLRKYGGRLEATKEALMGARLSLFDRWIINFARRIDRQKVRAALAVVKNGDGNNNPAPNVNAAGASPTIGDLVALLQKAAEYGAEPDAITGDPAAFGKLFELDFLTSPANNGAGSEQLRNTGILPVVLGMTPRMPPIPSVLDTTKQLLAIDPERGLIEVFSPNMDLVEYEYLMKRQMEAVQISEMFGLGKPDQGVGVTLTLQ